VLLLSVNPLDCSLYTCHTDNCLAWHGDDTIPVIGPSIVFRCNPLHLLAANLLFIRQPLCALDSKQMSLMVQKDSEQDKTFAA